MRDNSYSESGRFVGSVHLCAGLFASIADIFTAPRRRREKLVLEEMTRYMLDCEARGIDPRETWDAVRAETELKYRKIHFWKLWKEG